MLWGYRTTLRRSNGETPFSMTYRTKDMIPVEIGLPSIRIMGFSLNENDLLMTEQLDFMEENREIASIHLAKY